MGLISGGNCSGKGCSALFGSYRGVLRHRQPGLAECYSLCPGPSAAASSAPAGCGLFVAGGDGVGCGSGR